MEGEHADHVVVHDVDDEDKEEDEADLDEALFESEAEVAAANAFQRKKEDVAAIEDGDGQEIEDAKIDADENHEGNDGEGALGDGLTSGARNADDALELLDGDAAAEEFADHIDGLGDERGSLQASGLEGLERTDAIIREREFALNADLVVLFSAFGHTALGSDGESDLLAFAIYLELQGFAAGVANQIDKLIPVLDGLAVHGADDIGGAEAGAIGGRAESDFANDRRNGSVAEGAGVGIVVDGKLDLTSGAVVGDDQLEHATGSSLHSDGLSDFPSGILRAVDGNELVADLETGWIVELRRRKTGDDDGLGEKTVGRQTNGEVVAAEEQDWKNEIDGGAGERDEGALPTGLGEELIGSTGGFLIAGVDIGDVLASHANVAAEREGADAPVGGAALDAEKTRAEADGEHVHANAKEAGDNEVAPFVDENDDPENQDDADQSVHASA